MAKKLKEVIITDTNYPNLGIGTYGDDNREIHIKNALVGQKVQVVPGRNRTEYREGKLYNILEKSYLEDYEGCFHRDQCGGCSYQSISYEEEIKYKERQIKDLFNSIGLEVEEVVENPIFERYRNKMEYTFGDEYKDSPLALGMHKKNKFYEIVNNQNCLIVHEDFNRLIKEIRKYFEDREFEHFHKRTHEGNLRHLIIRRSTLGQILINLVVTFNTEIDKEDFIKFLLNLDLEGEIKSIFLTYNDSLSDAVIPEKVEKIYGEDYIEEVLCGLRFKITPFSFFQTNTISAEILYEKALELLGDIEDKVVFDLYSGTGTITQVLGKNAKKVYGIEIIEEAVESARQSAKENQIENVEFISGDVLEQVDKLPIRPDIIVLDPPRDGIHPKAINKIIDFDPEKFLYISCNPKTMVRDLEVFFERGYSVDRLKVVDQFPRTSHLEAVALLSKLDVDMHIDVEIKLDELDLTSAESKATYAQIKEYILEK